MPDIHPMVLLFGGAALTVIVALIGRRAAQRRITGILNDGHELRATPDYYVWLSLSIMFAPSVVLTCAAIVLQVVDVLETPGLVFAAIWIVAPLLLLAPSLRSISAQRNARVVVERLIYGGLLTAALISIFTTAGILLSVLFESIRFFQQVSILEFITGTTWSPGDAFTESARGEEGHAQFGALPLFAGTFMITGIAMLVAVPVGLLSAVYMSEYASRRVRRAAKPMLEILAGIPTVVYGFFAALTVAPLIVDVVTFITGLIGVEIAVDYQNAVAPGVIMGVMIIPFMSSLCDDVITSVPQNIRAASLALGATKSETIKRVVLPAALPGVISAFLISVSRAIGETMIVVMAAGLQANMSPNPFGQMTTVTVHIVANLTGDLEFDNAQTLSAFSLGLALLILTLALNIVSTVVIRKFRQRYEGD